MTNHITIHDTVPRIRYISNGVLSTYTYPFGIFKNSDLKVYFGSELQDSTTYTVSGAGESEGGTVTLSNVPESGVIITLTRELIIERTTDFQEGGALRANTLNHELDYQIACQQQIADSLNRSMVLPPYAIDPGIKLTLPLPSAGKAIVWNSAGTNLENSTIEVNALESTIKGYKEAAETAVTLATTKVGEAATQAQIAATQAQTATTQAQTATTQATTATTQAGIATQKAQEVASALSEKLNINGSNIQLSNFLTKLGFSSNITSKGYYKLPSGLIIQWGYDTTGGNKLFPIAFPSAALSIVSGAKMISGTNWYGQHVDLVSKSTYNVDIVSCSKLWWIAIGY